MKNQKSLICLTLFLVGFAFIEASAVEIRYQLPLSNSNSEILPVQLKLEQQSQKEVAEKNVFGSQIHRPFLSIIGDIEKKEKGSLLFQKEDSFSAELINSRLPFIRMISSGIPIFRNVSQSYALDMKISDPKKPLELEISSLEFDKMNGDIEYVRYQIFMPLINLPTLSQFDMRKDFRGSFASYMEKFTRHDANFGLTEKVNSGLRQTPSKSYEGYIFSSCALFRDISAVSKVKMNEYCQEFATSQNNEVFPINPGRKIYKKSHADFVYLIEREIKLRNEQKPQKAWVKVKVLPNQFVSLKNLSWNQTP